MNRDMATGEWQKLSGRIKQKWGRLTDDDLTRAQGDREYLVGKVHEHYGIVREKVEDDLENLGYGEHDEEVDLRSSDRSAAGRMDAAGYANAGGGSLGSEQGGNLDRESPAGRSSSGFGTGSTSNRGEPSQKTRGSNDPTVGDERNEEQNPSLRVEGEPPQPGGAGHTLEASAASARSGQAGRNSASKSTRQDRGRDR